MNGFLQRLVMSTRNPAFSIHPIVGSFYSIQHRGQAPESTPEPNIQRTEKLAPLPIAKRAPDAAESEEVRSQLLMPPISDVRRGIRKIPDSSPAAQPPHRMPPTSLTNPKIREDQLGLTDRTLNSVIERLLAPVRTPEERALEPVPQTTPEMDQSHSVSEDCGSESMTGVLTRRAEIWLRRINRSRLVPRSAESDRRIVSNRLEASRKEPDEIQIHIGRIEVTAVPPAPVIATPPQPRHSVPSLDEYLQRHGRRTQ